MTHRVFIVHGWGGHPNEAWMPWLEEPIETDRVRAMTASHLALFSDDDEVVPQENVERFERQLGAHTIVLQGKGHFSDDSGVTELPEALEFIVRNTQQGDA